MLTSVLDSAFSQLILSARMRPDLLLSWARPNFGNLTISILAQDQYVGGPKETFVSMVVLNVVRGTVEEVQEID